VFKPFHILVTSGKIQKSVKTAFNMAKEAAKEVKVTEFQARVYELLSQIPEGRVSTYAEMSKALDSSPRAVGGACRRNPFAPQVPCHRIIQADGYVGGFKGEWQKAPSGINQTMKIDILAKEGVKFDKDGMLLDKSRLWNDFNPSS